MDNAKQLLSTFDAGDLRRVFGAFVTGVTVITTTDHDGGLWGLTANSFTSLSLDPPMLLWCQSTKAGSHPVFLRSRRFAVNILADDQVDISRRFASKNLERFAETPHVLGAGGVPLLNGCVAHIECIAAGSHLGGDHVIFMGQVERIGIYSKKPLLFGHGRYLTAQPHETLLGDSLNEPTVLRALALASLEVGRLAQRLRTAIAIGVWGKHGPMLAHWAEDRLPLGGHAIFGTTIPVTESATGLVFAGYLPEVITADAVGAELTAFRTRSDVSRDAVYGEYQKRVAEVRKIGMARIIDSVSFADLYESKVSALSVPVFGADGRIVLALTAVGHSATMDTEVNGSVALGLRASAREICHALGCPRVEPDAGPTSAGI